MKVFILGGMGFIGYHTTLALLKQRHTVQTLTLPRFRRRVSSLRAATWTKLFWKPSLAVVMD